MGVTLHVIFLLFVQCSLLWSWFASGDILLSEQLAGSRPNIVLIIANDMD